MFRTVNLIFCVIWLFFLCAFAKFAWEASKTMDTTLARVSFDIQGARIILGPVDITKGIDLIVKTNNENVALLEESIRESARTSFWLNLGSAFFAFLGLVAQVMQYLLAEGYQNDKHGQQEGDPEPKLQPKKADTALRTDLINSETNEKNSQPAQD
jgi:hypothetical protein